MGKAGKIVRLVRVMRIMRIFKLVRHFAGLQSLIYTLNQVNSMFVKDKYEAVKFKKNVIAEITFYIIIWFDRLIKNLDY